ncbi:hypothetical protein T492DRAFT_603120 [Pavlovales sp. CCMP2436]|nr:hypothetical protein T492DRAFT_603120 [Pavlovales sp. CCMP2436]
MNVVKRNGKIEPVAFDKIASRLSKLTAGLDLAHLRVIDISQKVVAGIYDGVFI